LPNEAFDALNDAFLKSGDISGRIHNCFIGYFGLALELVRPLAISFSQQQNETGEAGGEEGEEMLKKLDGLMASVTEIRNEMIARGNDKFNLQMALYREKSR